MENMLLINIFARNVWFAATDSWR